ncbi:alpha/beta hydrolase family protein [Ceratobasidium sp. AG-Ba]|nr:alpha/beta hydrolase family protein [Ceratobasidium sp. AG-Ba]
MIWTAAFIASFSFVVEATHPPFPRQTSTISWSPCPDSNTTQCAFFDVPRDYTNPVENDTVSVFMRRYPASASGDNYLGSILVNPGGPGGSGAEEVLTSGESLSTIFEGRYDIIGFDPRGVSLTGPWTACFDVEAKPLLLDFQETLQGVPYPHSIFSNDRAVVNKLRAIQASHNAACVANGNAKMLESVGTAFVVQDMVKIVEALGEDGLNYLGYSYGTILGATFAAMRPDLVKRMVLDGVSDAQSYFNDVWQWGRDGMAETHKTYTGFLSTCIEAGPQHCAFAQPPGNSNVTQTTESLRQRINTIFARLEEQPAAIADSLVRFDARSRVVTHHRYIIWFTLLTPISIVNRTPRTYLTGPCNATGTLLENRSAQSSAETQPRPTYQSAHIPTRKISPVGEQWASIVGACSGWSFRAGQRYTGPWTTSKGLKKTRFPILFMSLDADPVTPLSSAVKMSRGFGKESATLLIQQGFGHCTTAHPSLCTYNHVRDYFIDGKVPVNGTHCTPEPGFIYPSNDTNTKRSVLTKRDGELLHAVEKFSKARAKSNGIPWGM